jgi:TetR/AcrR family fatty acid metabolism transcriptional regulator
VRTKTAEQAEKILAAASRLFGGQRYHEVRMDDVAAEAEVGKGTLYRYFHDKEELYIALLARCSEKYLSQIEQVVAGPGSPRERLEAVVAAIIDHFDCQPNLLNLIMRAEVMTEGGREFPWQEARDRTPRLIMDLFREAQARGDFTVREPELTTWILLGGIRAVIRFGKQPREANLATRIVENFLNGASAHAATLAARRKAKSLLNTRS